MLGMESRRRSETEGDQQDLQEEQAYLDKVLAFIRTEIETQNKLLAAKKTRLIASRREMWEETTPVAYDFAQLTEINQYLSELNTQTADYGATLKQIRNYQKIIGAPYFGRFDFREDGSASRDQIYIGLSNVMDRKTGMIFVYDWRAPIASIFYQYELGRVSYNAPTGIITGDISLKRQYKIQDSRLKYFFDCSVLINDEILQEVLSHNASPRMRNIVETIQKEQDLIIRDTTNELLIVQGVAGSGKTSIALHRIAFLLYLSINANVNANDFLILSPNAVFSKYISSVLPELGEENVKQITFDDIVTEHLNGRVKTETRSAQLESLIILQDLEDAVSKSRQIQFKGSRTFILILERLMRHYERHVIPFEDVYFDGKIIETGQRLKHLFLNNWARIPMATRLKRIEGLILDQVHPLQKTRRGKIEQIVASGDGHELEIKSFSRLLSMKQAKAFMDRLRKFTEVDYVQLYKMLFNEPGLFRKLVKGLELPADIEQLVAGTKEALARGHAHYEDCSPLLYLKLRIAGSDLFSDIRQVVIDEAQDYYPLQYEVFKLLFKNSRYTILGDINQTIEKEVDLSFYDLIAAIIDKKETVRLVLNKSYRSSYEINAFSQTLLGQKQEEFIPFNRHEAKPAVVFKHSQDLVDQAIARDIDNYFKQGFESVAVICKTQAEARMVHARLATITKAKLVTGNDGEIEKGVLVISSYMAKGLEFDVVLVPSVDSDNYASALDRKLLYLACTRALHHLTLYYTGKISPFLTG
ncbi:MAG: UvrD-helicase domain-containing protein [Thermacetogeniaceae bacterium]